MKLYLAILLVLAVLFGGCQPKINDAPIAINGILDLTNRSIKENGVVRLKGEWQFYWKQFLSQKDFRTGHKLDTAKYLESPGIWRHAKSTNEKVERHGYATLRLKVLLDRPENHLVLEIKDIRTAYEVEVNGEVIERCGRLGTSKATTIPEFVVKRPIIQTDSKELEIIVRLAEFHRDSGGIPLPIVLGTNEQINARTRNFIIEEWLLIGFLLFSAIYHFGLFFLRSRGVVNLYFGLFCINFIFRLLTRGEKVLFEMAPLSLWWLMNRLELIILYLIPILYLVYYNALFKHRLKSNVYYSMIAVFSILTAIVMFLPTQFITETLLIFQLAGLISLTYVMWDTYQAHKEGVKRSAVFLFGFAILFAGIVNDILHFNYIYRSVEVFNYSCIVFIFSQAYELAYSSVKAFDKEEELSRDLEMKVMDRTEQLTKANVVKSKLLSIVSHDLRGPLTSLHGLMDLSQNNQLEKDEANALMISLKKSLDSSLMLLDNILHWASLQLKSNSLEPQIESLNLRKVAQEARRPFFEQARQKNVQVQVSVPKDVFVMGDRNMLNSILRNLISNATKFTSENGLVVIGCMDKEDMVVTTISDNGVGLPEDVRATLFDPLSTKTNSGTSQEKGKGIGLLLCMDLIIQLDGKIWVEDSTENEGTSFSFSLPAG
ncbi:MAG: sensor histidine kinase [Cyclobacteriaceae bacterium]